VRLNFVVKERLIHGVKTAIAISAAFSLGKIIGHPADQWIVISTAVVMCGQIYVGGMMQKSYLRLFGTLLGCLMAIFTIFFLNLTFLTTVITIAISSFIFSLIATDRESWSQLATLGSVTTIIILFGNPPTVWFAMLRLLEISGGIIIAAVVSQFIFPIHARTHLRRSQAATFILIKDYYSATVINRFHKDSQTLRSELDDNIIKSLMKQRQLASDAAPELIGKRFDAQHFGRTLYCEREILRAINFIDLALSKVESLQSIYSQQNPLTPFNNEVMQTLDVLIKVLRTNNPASAHVHLPDISPMIQSLHQFHEQLTKEQGIYLDGFVFSAEVVINNLRELAMLYQIPVSAEPVPN
jgi:uncharacterized membrane protein YccC